MDDSTRDWKAVLDAERGEKAPDGWQWFGADGWGRGLRPDWDGFVFPSSDEARALPALRVEPAGDRGEPWVWMTLAWFSADQDPDPFGSGGWKDVAMGDCAYALDAIEAAEAAVKGDGLKALVVEYIRTWKGEMPTHCVWCLEAGEAVAVARVTKKGEAICELCAAECAASSLMPVVDADAD